MFLISLYGIPLTQRVSHLALHSSLFGPDGAVNYDYIVTNSINSLLIGSRCILNGAHTNHFWVNLAQTSKLIKNSARYLFPEWVIYCIHKHITITTLFKYPQHIQTFPIFLFLLLLNTFMFRYKYTIVWIIILIKRKN